jgi:hypothetical protein
MFEELQKWTKKCLVAEFIHCSQPTIIMKLEDISNVCSSDFFLV